MKIEKFNKRNLQKLMGDLEKVLKQFKDSHGVHFELAGARFDAESATIKLNSTVLSEQGEVEPIYVKNFKTSYHLFGLELSDLNKTLVHQGLKYKIVGIIPNNRKMPLIVERDFDDKRLKMGHDAITIYLNQKNQRQSKVS